MANRSRKGRKPSYQSIPKIMPDPAYIYDPNNPSHIPFDWDTFKIEMYEDIVEKYNLVTKHDYLHLMGYLAPKSKYQDILNEEQSSLIWDEVIDIHTASTCRNYGKSTNLVIPWIAWLIKCPMANFSLIVKYKQNFNEAIYNTISTALGILFSKGYIDEDMYIFLRDTCRKKDKLDFHGRKIDFMALNTPGSSLGVQPSSNVKPTLKEEYVALARSFYEDKRKNKEEERLNFEINFKKNIEKLNDVIEENAFSEEEENIIDIDLSPAIEENNQRYWDKLNNPDEVMYLQPLYLGIAIEELIKSSDHEKTGSEKELSFEEQMVSLRTIRSSLDRANGFNPFVIKVPLTSLMNPWDPNNEYYLDNVESIVPLVPHVGDEPSRIKQVEQNINTLKFGNGFIYRIQKDKDGIVKSVFIASHKAIPEERKDEKWWNNFRKSEVESIKNDEISWQHSAIYYGIPIPTIKDDSYVFKYLAPKWVENGINLEKDMYLLKDGEKCDEHDNFSLKGQYQVEDYFLGFDPATTTSSSSGSFTSLTSFLLISFFRDGLKYYKVALWKILYFNGVNNVFEKKLSLVRQRMNEDINDLKENFNKNKWIKGKEFKFRAQREIIVFVDPRADITGMESVWEYKNKEIRDSNLKYNDLIHQDKVVFIKAGISSKKKYNSSTKGKFSIAERDLEMANLIISKNFVFIKCHNGGEKCELKERCYLEKQKVFFNSNNVVPSLINHIEKDESGTRKQAEKHHSKKRHLTDVLDSIHYGLIPYIHSDIHLWRERMLDYGLSQTREIELMKN